MGKDLEGFESLKATSTSVRGARPISTEREHAEAPGLIASALSVCCGCGCNYRLNHAGGRYCSGQWSGPQAASDALKCQTPIPCCMCRRMSAPLLAIGDAACDQPVLQLHVHSIDDLRHFSSVWLPLAMSQP